MVFFLGLDVITTALPFAAGGGTVTRGSNNSIEGVYHLTTSKGVYMGQSGNLYKRISSHFKKGGKLSSTILKSEIKFEMKGSTKLEREVYEQYLILKYGLDKLLNIRNPMGGRMKEYYNLVEKIIKKYNLPH
jgi:hypothetical protein